MSVIHSYKYNTIHILNTSVIQKYTPGIIEQFPDSSVGKESTCNAGDPRPILGREVWLEQGQAIHSSILGLPLRLSW